MELVLVRHALPTRVERDDGTPADPRLSDLGRREVEALVEFLAGEPDPPAAVYASPMRRAMETAAPLAEGLALELQIDDDLAEFDRDSTAYVPIEEMRASGHPAWRAMVDGSYWDSVDLPGFQTKVTAAAERIIDERAGTTVAVVTHGGVINMYVSALLGLAPAVFFDPGYASISRVRASRAGRRGVVSLNETGHLRHLRDLRGLSSEGGR
jgi:probable phosphoglycerate mutase